MKKKIHYLLLTITSLFFYSCLISLGEFGNSDIDLNFKHIWENETIHLQSEIPYKNDTLIINKLEYVLSDIKLISHTDTILVINHQIIKAGNSFSSFNVSMNDVPNNLYKIVFTFGLKNTNFAYNDLYAQNFNTSNNGYYFLKLEGKEKLSNKNFSYHIAKDTNSSYINHFQVEINGFDVGNYYKNEAIIKMNVKNLFTNPNTINIEDLTSDVINKKVIHAKLLENTQNVFYLDRFVHSYSDYE